MRIGRTGDMNPFVLQITEIIEVGGAPDEHNPITYPNKNRSNQSKYRFHRHFLSTDLVLFLFLTHKIQYQLQIDLSPFRIYSTTFFSGRKQSLSKIEITLKLQKIAMKRKKRFLVQIIIWLKSCFKGLGVEASGISCGWDWFIIHFMNHKQFDALIEHIATRPNYNLKLLFAVCMIYTCGGIFVITVSLSVPIVKKQYQVEGSLLFLIASMSQIGFLIGGIACPIYFKNFSRRKATLGIMATSLSMTIILAMGIPLFFIYVFRFLLGVCLGLMCSIIPCIITQASSFEKRGFNFGIAFFVWPLGGLLPTFTFKYFETQQAINLSYIIVGIITVYVNYRFLPESPKHLIEIKKYSQSVDALKFMKTLGGLSYDLSEKEFQTIQEFTKHISASQAAKEPSSGIMSLFSPKLIKKTLIVALNFTTFFAFYNYIIYCLPQLLMVRFDNNKSAVQTVTYACLISESIAYLAAAKIVQTPSLGKKWTMIYCGIALFVVSVLLAMGFNITLCLIVCNLFLGVALTAIYPLTTEMFSIQHRLQIISLGVIFNELVPSIVTIVIGSVDNINLETPFLLIAGLLIPTVYYLFQLPEDKTDVGLDQQLMREKSNVRHM